MSWGSVIADSNVLVPTRVRLSQRSGAFDGSRGRSNSLFDTGASTAYR